MRTMSMKGEGPPTIQMKAYPANSHDNSPPRARRKPITIIIINCIIMITWVQAATRKDSFRAK